MERSAIASFFERAGLHAVLLDESQAGPLQDLHEQCSDFIRLATGYPPQLTEALDLLKALPAGKSLEDKFVLGFTQNHGALVRVLEVVRDYPDLSTWYIGLLMFAPQVRGQGLGRRVYETLEQWVSRQGGQSLRLVVQAQNVKGLTFWRRVGFKIEGMATQEIETRTNTVYKLIRYLTVPEERTV